VADSAAAAAVLAGYYDVYLRGWLPASKEAAVLDLGCGSGRMLRYFLSRGYANVAGVDLSPEQIAAARAVTPSVYQADALAFLAGHEGEFDVIAAFDFVEHLTKDELFRCLDLCYRALRPGGRIIVHTPNGASPFVGVLRYGDLTHETCYTETSLRWALALCGFTAFEAREAGPVAHGAASAVRVVLWRLVRGIIRALHYVETGGTMTSIHTRAFVASAVKPAVP